MKWPWSKEPAEGGGQHSEESNLTPTEPRPYKGPPGPLDAVMNALIDRATDLRQLETEVGKELEGIAIPFDVRQRLADVFHRAYFRLPSTSKE